MIEKKGKNGFVQSIIITLAIIALLILSGPIVEAVKVTLTADKTEVRAGDLAENQITFKIWVNLSSPDKYIPLQRVYLDLAGNSPRSFSFVLEGNNDSIQGQAFPGEISITPSGISDLERNYGSGYGYDFNSGGYYDFGYGYGYGTTPLNLSYEITLNTSGMFDGNYTATTRILSQGSSLSHTFSSHPISFRILPRVITYPIPSLTPNETNSSGLVIRPVGGFEWIVVANGNGAPSAKLNVTVSTAPLGGATTISSGAIPNLYYNISVDDPDWFKNMSHVQFRAYYNESNIPSDVLESTLRAYRYTNNIWVRLDCGDLGGCNAALKDGTILYDAGVNTTGNYVWANLSRFSNFAVAGTPSVSTVPYISPGSSSGGGGGMSSPEKASNIEVTEKYDLQISKDMTTIYRFTHQKNPIMFVNITGNTSPGIITTSVEVLKNTSTTVKTDPKGLVYINSNIWVGTSGFATPWNIKKAFIKFRVDNTWMGSNSVSGNDIKLLRWDGTDWETLETIEKGKDSTYTYFEAKTESFSPFAIVANILETIPGATPETTQPASVPSVAPMESTESTGTPLITYIIIAAAMILTATITAVYLNKKKKEKM